MTLISSSSTKRPRHRAVHALREGILAERWHRGSMFPTESELVKHLGVSRSTVRIALKQLEEEGLLRCERGRGRLVVGRQSSLMAQTVVILRRDVVLAEPFRHTGAEKAVEAEMTEMLRSAGRHILSLHAGGLSADVLDNLVGDHPVGVIADHAAAVLPEGQAALNRLAEAGSAVVVNGNSVPLQPFDRVVSDHAQGAYRLTRWLIEQGHKRIVRVWEDLGPTYWLNARDEGFERAMREAGLDAGQPLRVRCVTEPVDQEDPRAEEVFDLRARQYAGFLAEIVLRDNAPCVLEAMNDVSMLLVAKALRILGRTPGREIQIVGYDNFWPQSKDRRFEPYIPLATVDKRNHAIGRQTAELLLARLENKLPAGPQRIMVEPELIVSE